MLTKHHVPWHRYGEDLTPEEGARRDKRDQVINVCFAVALTLVIVGLVVWSDIPWHFTQ